MGEFKSSRRLFIFDSRLLEAFSLISPSDLLDDLEGLKFHLQFQKRMRIGVGGSEEKWKQRRNISLTRWHTALLFPYPSFFFLSRSNIQKRSIFTS